MEKMLSELNHNEHLFIRLGLDNNYIHIYRNMETLKT